ncbi:hypothetical protein G6F53_014219 [Rhizopus delemar]|nr:hypothetical protein G6F53_014219 [Rhizopus delemar]
MHRCGRIDIVECNKVLVLVDLLGRDVASGDLAEKTVGAHFPGSVVNLWGGLPSRPGPTGPRGGPIRPARLPAAG